MKDKEQLAQAIKLQHYKSQTDSTVRLLLLMNGYDYEAALQESRMPRYHVEILDTPVLDQLDPISNRKYREDAGLPDIADVSPTFYNDRTVGHPRGFEIEIGYADNDIEAHLDEAHHIDKVVQELGYLTGFDALRELILPPGSMRSNIAVLAELINLGIIKPAEQQIGMHITLGDIYDADSHIADILLLNIAAYNTGFFGTPEPFAETMSMHVDKPVFESDRDSMFSPLGYPVVIRENGSVEFRDLIRGFSDIHQFANALLSFENFALALSAYTKSQTELPMDLNEIENANLWVRQRRKMIEVLDQKFILQWGFSIEKYLELVAKYLSMVHRDASKEDIRALEADAIEFMGKNWEISNLVSGHTDFYKKWNSTLK